MYVNPDCIKEHAMSIDGVLIVAEINNRDMTLRAANDGGYILALRKEGKVVESLCCNDDNIVSTYEHALHKLSS